MHAALVVQVDVSSGGAGPASADGGVEVEPLPAPPGSGHQGQDVDVDVVEARGGDDLGRLGKFLPVGPGLADKVVVDGGVTDLAPDHGLVIVLVLLDVGHDFFPVPVVAVLLASEINAQATVVAPTVAADVPDIVSK